MGGYILPVFLSQSLVCIFFSTAYQLGSYWKYDQPILFYHCNITVLSTNAYMEENHSRVPSLLCPACRFTAYDRRAAGYCIAV